MNPALAQIAQALGIDVTGMDDAAATAAILQKVQGQGAVAASLKAAQDRVTALSAQVGTLEAARGKPIEVDLDSIMASVDSTTLMLDQLVERKCITKVVRDDLAAVFLGTPDSRPALCLSHKAAIAAGFPGAIAKTIIAALLKNDGKALALAAGERTGAQRGGVALSRTDPDAKGDEPPTLDPDIVNRQRAAYGKPPLAAAAK